MSGRKVSQPPALAGYSPIELIGTGGYADVFLYEQQMPNRKVAVKVLVSDALSGDVQRRQFTAEANLMAKVSSHPFIVSIIHADVAPDGRPYIIMEYYPGDNYLRRARREQFGVAEVLRVGVQVGSALETAHRAGILHRDLKPANILTSEYGRPGLADFGIASAQGPQADETEGVSIPWSPPEAFGAADLGVTADVYSLAATLYHLLAARSPYEVPGGDNSALGLMSRIERGQLPPIGRPDVPPSLQRLLAQALAKDAAHRPSSVVAFLRQLQGVEAELKLAVTPLELADDGATPRARVAVDDDDATRIKGVTEIQAQAPASISSIPSNPESGGPLPERRREGLLAEPEISDTIHRPAAPPTPASSTTAGQPKRLMLSIAGAVLAAVAAVLIFVAMRGGDASQDETSSDDIEVNDGVSVIQVAEPPVQVAPFSGVANADGTFTFTWTAVPQAGATYAVTDDATELATQVDGVEYTGPTACIEVATIAASGLISGPVRGCV